MAALGEVVTLDHWREVVTRALADAKSGDGKARDWLTRYVLGPQPRTFLEIAADESLNFMPDAEIELKADELTDFDVYEP
jgi:hypothetical protein